MEDSGLVAKPVGKDQRTIVASPAYLKEFGLPETPLELQEHNVLLFSNPAPQRVWSLYDQEGKKHEVKVSGNFETNNCETLNKVTLAGLGISLRPKWDVWRKIEEGVLVPLLTDYRPPSYDIQAVYPNRAYLPYRVRVFIDLLAENLAKESVWNI